LTVNHVFDLICAQLELKDWKKAIEKAIPERKKKKEVVKTIKLGEEEAQKVKLGEETVKLE